MNMRILSVGAAALAVMALAVVPTIGDEPERTPTPDQDQPPARAETTAEAKSQAPAKDGRVRKPDAEWRKILSPQEYYVTRRKGTEPAYSGRYWNHHGDGIYRCVCCNTTLFDSRTKFESGTGWPSFYAPVDKAVIRTEIDRSNFSIRTEVLCRVCDAHLGHVFKDGPRPTGLRFCMNSASLRFQDRAQAEAEAAAKAILEASPTPEPDPSTEPAPDAEPESGPGPEPEPEDERPASEGESPSP